MTNKQVSLLAAVLIIGLTAIAHAIANQKFSGVVKDLYELYTQWLEEK